MARLIGREQKDSKNNKKIELLQRGLRDAPNI